MLFGRKTQMVTADQALPGRPSARSRPEDPRRARHPARGPVAGGPRGRVLRDGLLLGRRADLLAGARRRDSTAVGYQGGITPNPTYEETCTGAHRPHRGRPGRLRPGRGLLRGRCSRCSGRTTTRPRATGRATTSAPSTGRRSTRRPPEQQARAEAVAETASSRRCAAKGYGPITTEIAPARHVLLRRGLPPAVPRQGTRTATGATPRPGCPTRPSDRVRGPLARAGQVRTSTSSRADSASCWAAAPDPTTMTCIEPAAST